MRRLSLGLLIALTGTAAIGWGHHAGEPLPSPSAYGADRSSERMGTVRGTGFVEPATELRRLAFKVDGVIESCRVHVGQQVAAGEMLMSLSNGDEQAAIGVATQELALARADRQKLLSGVHQDEIAAAKRSVELLAEQRRHAHIHLDRTRKLSAARAATVADFDRAESDCCQIEIKLAQAESELRRLETFVRPEDCVQADARVQLAEARLAAAQQRLADTRLLAPLDGTVLEINRREGEGAQGRQCVIVFGNQSRLRVRAEVDERYVHLIALGQTVNVYGAGLGNARYQGTVAVVKQLMGKKTVFVNDAEERKDLDVMQVLIDLPAGFRAPIGLQIDVEIETQPEAVSPPGTPAA